MNPQKLFPKEDQEMVKNAIQQAERKISGEIVPVVARTSGNYLLVPFALSIVATIAASLSLWFLRFQYPYLLEPQSIWMIQIAAFFVGGLLGECPWLIRKLTPYSVLDSNVRRNAMAEFMDSGVHSTHHRTGILIYISVLERKVVILADGGVHGKLGPTYWEKSVAKIVQGIRARHPGKALSDLILEIGDQLKEHFPHGEEDQNEIADGIRFRL